MDNYAFDVRRGASRFLLEVAQGNRWRTGEGIKGRLDLTKEGRKAISLVTESKMSQLTRRERLIKPRPS